MLFFKLKKKHTIKCAKPLIMSYKTLWVIKARTIYTGLKD